MREIVLIAMMGLPRSGKTTKALTLQCPVVCPDAIRLALHGQPFVLEAEPMVWAIAKIMVRSLFVAGHDLVVLDATNVSRERRDVWQDSEWATYFWEVDTPADVCRQRAEACGFPVEVIDRMDVNYEPLGEDEATFADYRERR